MAVEFACTQCRQRYRAPDRMTSRSFLCKRCKSKQTIPTPRQKAVRAKVAAEAVVLLDNDDDDITLLSPPERTAHSNPGRSIPPQRWSEVGGRRPSGGSTSRTPQLPGHPPRVMPTPQRVSPSLLPANRKEQSKAISGHTRNLFKYAAIFWCCLVVLGVVIRAGRAVMNGGQNVPEVGADEVVDGQFDDQIAVEGAVGAAPGVPNQPRLPNQPASNTSVTYSEPVNWRKVAPGVKLTSIQSRGRGPGQTQKILLYLPESANYGEENNLPCIFITGAGTRLIHGVSWDADDEFKGSPEHIPWAQAGYVVVAFEEDGALTRDDLPDAEFQKAIVAFHRAQAGILNGKTAVDFALTKLNCIDPKRLYAVGHSSAGTLALILAANEPRIRGVVAFAPAVDLKKRFGKDITDAFRKDGLSALAESYSPRNNEDKLQNKEVFLFHAQGDRTVEASESIGMHSRLKANRQAPNIELKLVPAGDHYNSMIRDGIPAAIQWVNTRPTQ